MDVRVENLSFSYRRGKPILDGLSFEAREGEITAIVGANGAGKTTLVRSILGYLTPRGEVYLGKKNRKDYTFSEVAALVGYLTQESAVQAALTVFDVVLLGRLHRLGLRVDPAELEKVWIILKKLKIDHLADRPYNELSGGQRRVVNIAQTLVKEPNVLILDEPTANLDMQNEIEMLELVRAYTRDRRAATLVILHDLSMACRYADRILILKDGRVFCAGTPLEVVTEESVREAYGVNVRLLMADETTPLLHILGSVRPTDYHFVEE